MGSRLNARYCEAKLVAGWLGSASRPIEDHPPPCHFPRLRRLWFSIRHVAHRFPSAMPRIVFRPPCHPSFSLALVPPLRSPRRPRSPSRCRAGFSDAHARRRSSSASVSRAVAAPNTAPMLLTTPQRPSRSEAVRARARRLPNGDTDCRSARRVVTCAARDGFPNRFRASSSIVPALPTVVNECATINVRWRLANAPCHRLQAVSPTANILAMYDTIHQLGERRKQS